MYILCCIFHTNFKFIGSYQIKNANKICVPFNYFCYVRFNLENISTNVTVLTKSMQLSMWFYNGKNIHTVHSTQITVQFLNPIIPWRRFKKIVGECFSNVLCAILSLRNMPTIVKN